MAAGLSSCRETLITTIALDEDPKLVVGCFINPNDTIIQATLSESRLLYRVNTQEWGEQIKNATLVISNGSVERQLVWVDETFERSGGYFLSASQMPILPGQTYTLRATHPDGRVVIGTTTVPAAHDFAPSVSSVITIRQSENFLVVSANWRGTPDQLRFYRFNYGVVFGSGQTNPHNYLNNSFYDISQYLSDRDAADKLVQFRAESYYWNSSGNGERIRAQLQELDVHSYFYLSSLARQGYNDGPFTEPAPIYSNIEGGLGCFGSSHSYVVFSDPF